MIEGDQETVNDAERIRSTGCRVVQINTGAGCHLEADMVIKGIHSLDPAPNSVIMIENVGNLVCPALFDLGESVRLLYCRSQRVRTSRLNIPTCSKQHQSCC